MQKFLPIATGLFVVIIIFYLTQIHFEEGLFSTYNMPYTICIMIAIIGILFCIIFMQMSKLKKPTSEMDQIAKKSS